MYEEDSQYTRQIPTWHILFQLIFVLISDERQMRGLSGAFVSTHNALCFISKHYERDCLFGTVGC